MIRFEGVRTFTAPVDVVHHKLTDCSFLVDCLHQVDHVTERTADRAAFRVKTGFSFLSASLDVVLTLVEKDASGARFRAESKGIGATSVVEARMEFRPGTDGGSAVSYSAEVTQRTGLLKIVSSGLIQSAAKSVIEDTWKAIEARVAAVGA